jgi:4-amino-4-deoxychorismate lyase
MIDVLPADVSIDAEAGIRQIPDGTASLDVRDLGPARGDGIFETIGVIGGHPQALDAHLKRLANSASLLDHPSRTRRSGVGRSRWRRRPSRPTARAA